MLDLAVSKDIINKSGTWFSYGDIKLGQGRENAKQYLKKNKELALEIEEKVRKAFNLASSNQSSNDDGEAD